MTRFVQQVEKINMKSENQDFVLNYSLDFIFIFFTPFLWW